MSIRGPLRIFFAQYADERGKPDSTPIGRVDLIEIAPLEIGSRLRSYELVRSRAVIGYMRVSNWTFEAHRDEFVSFPHHQRHRTVCFGLA